MSDYKTDEKLIERLITEADLCRNESAVDIANLLDEASKEIGVLISEVAAANEAREKAEKSFSEYKIRTETNHAIQMHDAELFLMKRAESAERERDEWQRRAEESLRILKESLDVLHECRGTLQVDQHDGHRRISKKIENTCGRLDAALKPEKP